MSHDITVPLSDQLYTAIKHEANSLGTTPAQVVVNSLNRQFGRKVDLRTEEEKQAAIERFNRNIGSVNLGYATGVDNEQIDADLASEYGNMHEEG
jgi:hypothetical protein